MQSHSAESLLALQGDSPKIRSLMRTIDQVAEADAPVLIIGKRAQAESSLPVRFTSVRAGAPGP